MGAVDVEVTGRFSASTVQAQLKAVVAGLGIGLLPSTMVLQSVRAGRLVEVLPGYGRSTDGFYVVYPSRRQIPRAVTAFVDMTVERLLDADLVAG
jgi:LysR family transcriptional regulator AphB